MKIVMIFLFIITISFVYALLNKGETLDISQKSFSFYDYEAKSIDGETIKLRKFIGKKSSVGKQLTRKEKQNIHKKRPR